MRRILIPETKEDTKIIEDMVEQEYACRQGKLDSNTSAQEVAIVPNTEGGWAKWTVIDNRGGMAITEDFSTLDGAMIYASDIRTSCEGQLEWDVDGKFREMLIEAINKTRHTCDALERWGGKDHDELVELFVESIIDNVNGEHTVNCLEDTNRKIEIVFNNTVGAMVEIDNALEQLNGRDFRVICDKFLVGMLRRNYINADIFEWPTPSVEVTRSWYEDEDDVTKSVRLVWDVDARTWDCINKILNKDGLNK